MDGLEAVEIRFSAYQKADRFDSEFFKKKYLHIYAKLHEAKRGKLSEVALVTDGNHQSIAESFSDKDGVRYLRGQDISNDLLIDNSKIFIPEYEYEKLKRSHIFNEDVLITIVGANTGNTGIVYNFPKRVTANCKLGIARVFKGEINAYFLHVFLAGKYGQQQIKRNIRGGGQTGLILPDLKNLIISRYSKTFENSIVEKSKSVYQLIEKSKKFYQQAETLLLNELGLHNWQPTQANTYCKVKMVILIEL